MTAAVSCVGLSGHLDRGDGDLAAARIVLSLELHLLAFAQAIDAGALQSGGVNENVLVAAVRLDEAEAFLVVVELQVPCSFGIAFH